MQLIDTHCHLTFPPLADNVDQVVQRSLDAGVKGWVTVGTDVEHSIRAIELTERFPSLFVAVGIHPHEAGKATRDHMDRVAQLATSRKVVALGETGLDLHYLHSCVEDQQRVFVWHLELAARLQMPVVIHSREAFDQTLEVLDRHPAVRQVVFHCFTGTPDQAKTVLERGFYLSFSVVVTFKNAGVLQEVAREAPSDRILIETDCPYLSPEPMRKQRTNEPALMVHTARFMATLRHMDLDALADMLTHNARRFYGLQPAEQ
jgi:TatD DNase family protein